MKLLPQALFIAPIAMALTAAQSISSPVALTTQVAQSTNSIQRTDQAVTYQINQAHSGFVRTQGLKLPLKQKWAVTLAGSISYPLIAEGKVFVTTRTASSKYGTKLYALNATTGQRAWGPIDIPGTYYWSNAAYDAGLIFVINSDGLLRAFDAKTGRQKWSRQLPGQYSFSAPPTAANGIVYVGGAGSGGTLYAVNEANGAVLWSAPVANGGASSPALSRDGVYVSYPCQVYKFSPQSGSKLWQYSGGCSGGGGNTPVYDLGRLYVWDWSSTKPGYVFNGKTGQLLSTYQASLPPALFSNLGVFLNAGKLEGRNLITQAILWSFAGDGSLISAPIIINQYAYIGSSTGKLYAVNLATGREVWSTNVGASISRTGCCTAPTTGLGAGEGLLVVPAGNRLVAYEGR